MSVTRAPAHLLVRCPCCYSISDLHHHSTTRPRKISRGAMAGYWRQETHYLCTACLTLSTVTAHHAKEPA